MATPGDPSVPPEVRSSRPIYANPWIQVREDELRWADGADRTYGLIEMAHGVTVAAVTADRQVALVREFKPAVGEFRLELISGGIDDGETPLAAGQRELLEEIGGRSERWEPFPAFDPFTALIHSPSHLYAAWDTVIETPDAIAGEILEVRFVPLDEAVAMAWSRQIKHGPSVVLLLSLALSLDLGQQAQPGT
jgi:ADP-ribose pyrophosphatase